VGSKDVAEPEVGPRSTRSVREAGATTSRCSTRRTVWHLSYVAVGAALAPRFHLDRMLWAIAAFALAMGVAAHALDG
jgi:hypothetical protein